MQGETQIEFLNFDVGLVQLWSESTGEVLSHFSAFQEKKIFLKKMLVCINILRLNENKIHLWVAG